MIEYIPYKTLLTEATYVNWFLRELVADPKNEAKAKRVELLFKSFMAYRNEMIKKTK